VSLLGQCASEQEVQEKFRSMSLEEWLKCLGPAEWESLCLGYLIQKESYLPTGLSVGRTLAILDIVGVNATTGDKIVAQCKKTPTLTEVSTEFLEASTKLHAGARVYFFAYGDCSNRPDGVRVVTGDDMLAWLGAEGRRYFELWHGR